MKLTRRVAGIMAASVAAVALPLAMASPAQAACPSGTYPPSSCAPALSMTSPTGLTTLSSARVGWKVVTSGAAIKYYQARYIRAAWNGNLQSWVYPSTWQHLTSPAVTQTLPLGYTYCYSARGVDTANRVGSWSTSKCTARPLDDRSLSLTTGWTRGTSSAYYQGTYSLTRRLGARAVRTSARLSRVGVVGVTCSTCGTVGVYVGSTLVGKLNFASSTTHYKAVLYTSKFSMRTGTVTLRNLTSRRVIVDGLAVLRY